MVAASGDAAKRNAVLGVRSTRPKAAEMKAGPSLWRIAARSNQGIWGGG